jgi:hypothetical protein
VGAQGTQGGEAIARGKGSRGDQALEMIFHGLVAEDAGFMVVHDVVKLLWFDFLKSVSVL